MNDQPRYYKDLDGKLVLQEKIVKNPYNYGPATMEKCCIRWARCGTWKQERPIIDFHWFHYEIALGAWGYS